MNYIMNPIEEKNKIREWENAKKSLGAINHNKYWKPMIDETARDYKISYEQLMSAVPVEKMHAFKDDVIRQWLISKQKKFLMNHPKVLGLGSSGLVIEINQIITDTTYSVPFPRLERIAFKFSKNIGHEYDILKQIDEKLCARRTQFIPHLFDELCLKATYTDYETIQKAFAKETEG